MSCWSSTRQALLRFSLMRCRPFATGCCQQEQGCWTGIHAFQAPTSPWRHRSSRRDTRWAPSHRKLATADCHPHLPSTLHNSRATTTTSQHMFQMRFSGPSHLVYTDGSKLGMSITGGVYQEAHGIKESFSIVDHDPDLNTVLRAELVALHRALHIPSFRQSAYPVHSYRSPVQHSFAEQSNHNPESLRTHKHIYSLKWPGPSRLTQTVSTTYKCVHTLLCGEMKWQTNWQQAHAPGLATDAFNAAGKSGRGDHWVHYLEPTHDGRDIPKRGMQVISNNTFSKLHVLRRRRWYSQTPRLQSFVRLIHSYLTMAGLLLRHQRWCGPPLR